MLDFLTQSNERFWLVGRMFSVVSKHVVVLQTIILLFHLDLAKLQNTLLKGWLIVSFPHIEQLEKSATTTQEDKEKIQSLEGNR